jgi:hypothetical protein
MTKLRSILRITGKDIVKLKKLAYYYSLSEEQQRRHDESYAIGCEMSEAVNRLMTRLAHDFYGGGVELPH